MVGKTFSQQMKSRMKAASIFGMYEVEWNDGDWWARLGEVPIPVINLRSEERQRISYCSEALNRYGQVEERDVIKSIP